MKKIFLTFLIVISELFPQGTAGDKPKYDYRSLIDIPVAGIIKKGCVGVTLDVLPGGALINKIEAGVFENLSIAVSYGGGNIIGTGNPKWYKYPGVDIRYRVINESMVFPAILVGFDTQGKGQYFDSTSRYEIKSPGFYSAVSKNFAFLGFFALHGALNYSLESKDGDNYLNLSVGFEKTLGRSVSFITEYNFALNDNSTKRYGNGNGYLNMGLRWSVADGFTLGFDLRDLLDNKRWKPSSADRALRIEYIKPIL